MSLQKWLPAQDSPEVPVNENFKALEHMAVYAKDATTTTGLTWGYLGGNWRGVAIAAGTLSLTANATNYVVVNRETGAVSVSATDINWNAGLQHAHVYRLVTGAATVTSVEDFRAGRGGVHGIGHSPITISSTAPSNPQVGDLWLNIS